ncbi:aminomethyltransferase beta-barrel domain-containing protein, partial [Rhizobium ruizarguesonis]
ETPRFYLRDISWLVDGTLAEAASGGVFACYAKVRSTRAPAPAVLHVDAPGTYVDLTVGEAGLAPGQACALYSAPAED